MLTTPFHLTINILKVNNDHKSTFQPNKTEANYSFKNIAILLFLSFSGKKHTVFRAAHF